MGQSRWTVVIPYYNEEAWLPRTLASISAQICPPFRAVLVDNGSTDGSAELARAWALTAGNIRVSLLSEPVAGKIHALATGISAVDTEFLALCDADTLYPPHYLQAATTHLDAAGTGTIGFIAHDCGADPDSAGERARRWLYTHVVSRLLTHQAHGGGYAHLMRTQPFRAAGGYDARLWLFVLEDHEVVNRLWKHGRVGCAQDLWVQTSSRRTDRTAVNWTLFERLLYNFTLPVHKDWFFHHFLAPRLAARGQTNARLRERNWEDADRG